MHQLADALQQALRELDAGTLGLEALERSTDDAQALYERLVVLRHKAREAKLAPAVAATPVTVDAPIAELPPMRLDTRPGEISPRQTSLIDAIAETETKPRKAKPTAVAPVPVVRASDPSVTEPPVTAPTPVAEEPKPAPPKQKPVQRVAVPAEKATTKGPSLADKMEHAPVADLHKAIALSQKFWFVAELFAGQREHYEKAIDTINAAKDLAAAKAFVQSEIVAKLPKPPGDDVLGTFLELVERRFR